MNEQTNECHFDTVLKESLKEFESVKLEFSSQSFHFFALVAIKIQF